MSFTVILRAEASDEAVEAAGYILEHASLDAAILWYKALDEAIDSLKAMPTRFGLARENGIVPGCELRQLIFKSHRLIFTIRARQVHILHVRHGARATLDLDAVHRAIQETRD